MYRVTRVGRTWYAIDIGGDDLKDNVQEIKRIQEFVNNGDVVILADDLGNIQKVIGEKIVIVDRDE